MKTKTNRILMGDKTVGFLFAAAFALGASQIATAATTQSFLFYGQSSGISYWSDGSSWRYTNGGSGTSGNWKTTSGNPGGFDYDVYFRSPMKAPNNNSCSYNSSWDHVVTFSGAERIGKTATTGQPLHLDAGSSAAKPIVFTATQSDYGLTSSSTLNIAEEADGYLTIDSGTYSFGYVILGNGSGKTGVLTMNGGTLKILSNYTRLGNNGSMGILTVKTGAVFDTSEASGNGKNMTLGQSGGSTGILNVEGGDVTIAGNLNVNYNGSSKNSAMNITDGGVLTVGNITFGGTVANTVTIDNGTIKAHNDHANFIPSNSILTFTVGAGGGTIDNNGYSITIGAAIGGTGGMTFKGNGTTTLSGTPSYTGGTTNVAGTVLSLTAAAKAALVAYPIAVEIPPTGAAEGKTVFEINDGNGTFTQAEVDAMVVTGTDASRYALSLADGGTKVVISDTLAGEYVWNDGASGESWLTTGKWSKNGVAGDWYGSTAAVFANAGDKATVDSAVTAGSVIFRANATVDGSAALTVPVIAVSNGVSAAINAPLAGTVEKIGAGTLTLSQSRTEKTVVTEGALVMSGAGATIPWDSVLLGTEAGKTAVLKFENGATLASVNWNISLGHDVNGPVGGGVTVELHKDGGDWYVPNMFTAGWNNGDVGRFYHNDGSLTVVGQCRVSSQAGSSGEFTMNGGTVTVSNNLYVGCNYNVAKGVFNMNGGSFTCIGTTYVSFSKNDDPAELHINGGTFTSAGTFIAGNDNSASVAVIDLNAIGDSYGVLETKGLTLGKGSATLTFNGGELKAVGDLESSGLIKNGIAVRVGANGGVVNANGKSVSIPATIGAAGDTGAMTYKGGGTITLSAPPAYSGKTTIELGTTLVVPVAIAGANLEVTVPAGLPAGIYKIAAVSGDGAFASDILSTATFPSGLNARFFLEKGGKEIWCIYSNNASDHIWIGGSEGSLNDGANWLSGSVPESGTAIIGNPVAAALTNPEGSGFAATTIVVPDGSAPVAISGAKFSNVSSVTNNSSSTIEFENAVEFSGNVDVVQSTGAVKFTGGATGTWLARATDIHGTYNFTGSGERTEHGGTTVKSDGVYKLPNATFYKHNGDFHMEAGGRAEVKAAKISAKDSDKKLLGTFNGEFKVNGEFVVSAPDGKDPTHYTCNSGNGTFIVDKIRVNQNACIVPCKKTIMGPGGIIRGAGYVRVNNSGSHEFGSYADWTMYYDNLGDYTTTPNFVLFKRSSSSTWSTVTFDTTDYYDNTIGRTITSEAQIGAENAASAEKFGVTVKGIGKFVFANTHDDAADDKKIFSGGLTVTNSATVEVMANSCPGTGPVTLNGTSTLLLHTGGSKARTGAIMVNDGATLKVAESGTVKLGGDLRLNDGATLAFNFTDRKNAPVLDLTGREVTFGTQAQVKVSLSGDRPIGGKHILTSGSQIEGMASFVKADDCPKWVKGVGVDGDGNLYAEVFANGMVIICQ